MNLELSQPSEDNSLWHCDANININACPGESCTVKTLQPAACFLKKHLFGALICMPSCL
jgi:hypothetical protein